MATEFTIGPALDEVIEPAPPAPDRIPVVFGTPATEPGGIVHLKLDNTVQGVAPLSVMVIFIPKDRAPAPEARTVEFYLASSFIRNSAAISGDEVTVKVDGVTPGAWFVQVLNEYAKIA